MVGRRTPATQHPGGRSARHSREGVGRIRSRAVRTRRRSAEDFWWRDEKANGLMCAQEFEAAWFSWAVEKGPRSRLARRTSPGFSTLTLAVAAAEAV